MIYFYPANKMENLLALFQHIQQVSPLPLFSKDTIIVQNKGMQHWLNMQLAEANGIAMNYDYALPSQFLWKLLRNVLSSEKMPEQTLYSRTVLVWRIDQLFSQQQQQNNPIFDTINQYWQQKPAHLQAITRFQFSQQIADLFEQYLVFRPHWLDRWEKGQLVDELNQDTASRTLQQWQATLWQLLTKQLPYNPLTLIEKASQLLSKTSRSQLTKLPKRISFFGINSLAPMWLDFIATLSQYTTVHFFHLNPCANYWGDIASEKQLAKQNLLTWADLSATASQVGNPLLANLGQQGREFVSMLQQYSTIEIEAFEQLDNNDMLAEQNGVAKNASISVLQSIQQDILTLTDARLTPQQKIDDSIMITSAHSALREVQGLHDWLLHQFNQDEQLKPRDILVMCPQVENYAPYIESVFSQGWHDLNSDLPPLPCSIADRITKDSDPIIASFLALLALPDSRFQLTQLLSYLRLPAIHQKFAIDLAELDQIAYWLSEVCVHWGLDSEHKSAILESKSASSMFTWQQGLERLMLSFAYGDTELIYNNLVISPWVDGQQGLLLGKLLLFIEQLQQYTKRFSGQHSANQWVDWLYQLKNDLYLPSDERALEQIDAAIATFSENINFAEYDLPIELSVVREFLTQHFSEPDSGSQFLVGQVTFCSMLPMRSIPFKVIAILGLNDGEFPRQRQISSLDLIANQPMKIGDRSRRGDDRYLFLEALICARKQLYLSYQGKNIRNNTDRQPSLVLQELLSYLHQGYGWPLNEDNNSVIRQMPLQPFSEHNFEGKWKSFDQKWLNLNNANQLTSNPLFIDQSAQSITEEYSISFDQLVAFFDKPSQYFANQQLSLYFSNHEIALSDVEPFDIDALGVYKVKHQLLNATINQLNEPSAQPDTVIQRALLSGNYPESPTTAVLLAQWQQSIEEMVQTIQASVNSELSEIALIDITIKLPINGISVSITARLPIIDQRCLYYRVSSAKPKDKFILWLSMLLIDCFKEQNNHSELSEPSAQLLTINQSMGVYFNTKKQAVDTFSCQPIEQASSVLTHLIQWFLKGQQQALLIDLPLAEQCSTNKTFNQTELEKYWYSSKAYLFSENPYIRYFWPDCPNLSDIEQPIFNAYGQFFQHVQAV